jgi:RNA polymerase sigma-54 factor
MQDKAQMELALAPQMRPQQSLGVSPALIASAQLLALGAIDLAETVQRELEENPALVLAERPSCRVCGSSLDHGEGCRRCGGGERERESPLTADPLAAERLATVAERTSDAHRLLAELRLALPAGEHSIAETLVASLDERGYLTAAPHTIAGWLGVDPARVESVLAELCATGPAGIAAHDLRKCLLLQLDRCEGAHELARAVVSEHLHALAAGRYGAVARALGVEREEILRVRDFIRGTLRPTPGFAGADGAALCPALPPDVVVDERPEGLRVRLTEPQRFALRVCPLYARLSEEGTASERRHASHHATRAREFATRLEQRWDTMLRVMRLAVERQAEWVLRGGGPRRPLTRVEIARALSLNESTVSRATRERSMQLPGGRVVATAELFVSGDEGREALRTLLEQEPRALTDSELVEALAARGHRLARRTVAKYRAQLGQARHTLR